ncbi:CvpA family protein [Kineobactrum salinum]|uniref:CvpA family protein n=1 Tax=Kineobactrum salinum TaxID=2708301 RepID=A0A6C0U5Z8_9GAMM|nr:CvpA family protein [Kineobactrum salinum]QIB67283.1 CvpA family protein [Kineobactrum salinum]
MIDGFTWVDWAIAVIVVLSTLLSLLRGFTREALSLAGWIAAFVLANLFASELATQMADLVSNLTARYIAAWLVIFVAILLVAGLTGMLLAQLVKVSGLGTLDRVLGTVFGFARGVVIVLVLVFLIRELLPPRDQVWLHQAQLMPQVDALMNWVLQLLGGWSTAAPAAVRS